MEESHSVIISFAEVFKSLVVVRQRSFFMSSSCGAALILLILPTVNVAEDIVKGRLTIVIGDKRRKLIKSMVPGGLV